MSHYSFKAKCPACMALTNWSAIDLGRDGYQYACRRCGYVTYDKPAANTPESPVGSPPLDSEHEDG